MKSNLTIEKVKINKIIFNKNIEHSIDLEYQLPDYYTGIFKVLEFKLEPHISSCRASNKQFIIDGNTIMKLLYLDEEGGNIKSIQHNIAFSKTVDVEEEITDSVIYSSIKTNYANCKIISPKKLDLKATLAISVKIQSKKEENILKKTKFEDVQLKNEPFFVTTKNIWTTQQSNINEQIELENKAKEILDVRINITEEECKIISNKIISKATAQIDILYCSEEKNQPILKRTLVPINNIIDMPNISENYVYNVIYDVSSINYEILQEGKFLNVQSDIIINSYGSLCETMEIVTDAFSTKYETKKTIKEFKSSSLIASLNKNITIDKKIDKIKLKKIYDIYADITNLNYSKKEKQIKFDAKLNLNAIGANKENSLETYSKSMPISFNVACPNLTSKNININIHSIKILDIVWNITEDKTLEIRLNLMIKSSIFSKDNIMALTDIKIEKDKPKEKSKSAITLYYPESGEKVWDIAKHFCTSPKEIIEVNEMENNFVKNETMLIIPII